MNDRLDRLRILMAVPKYPFPILGGLEKQAHELSKALIKLGHEVHVITGLFDDSQQGNETIDGAYVSRLKWFNNPLLRYFNMIIGLALHMYKIRRVTDIIHIHQFTMFGFYVQFLAKVYKLPVITKLPNVGKAGIPGLQKKRFGIFRIKALKLADAIIAMTPESMNELHAIKYPYKCILKVTNGILYNKCELNPVPKKVNGTTKVVFVGRLVEQKGIFTLLKAWTEIPKSVRSLLHLDIVGEGPLMQELNAYVIAKDLAKSVKFLGHVDNVSSHLSNAQVFVLPSYVEGNSNAILEAMLAGLPIIATDVGGTNIQVGLKGKEFLFKPDDHKTLAKMIQQLAENEELRYQTGKAMRQRIFDIFCIDDIASTYEKAYRLIIAGNNNEMFTLSADLFSGNEE